MAVNPNDTEEAIWAYLAEAQLVGAAAARQQLLQACLRILLVCIDHVDLNAHRTTVTSATTVLATP